MKTVFLQNFAKSAYFLIKVRLNFAKVTHFCAVLIDQFDCDQDETHSTSLHSAQGDKFYIKLVVFSHFWCVFCEKLA